MIKKIAVIGTGVIGTGWIIRFLAHNKKVIAYDKNFKLKKGWRLQYSTRYDELASQFQENDVSLVYDNPCQCWGFGFDFIKRHNINGGINQNDTRFMFRVNLKGLGSFGTKSEEKLLHRNF